MDEDREELEHIPWSELTAMGADADRRRKLMYLAAGAIGAMVLGAMVARAFTSTPAAPTAPGTTPIAVGESVELPASTTSTSILYQEADLFAFLPETDGAMAAAVRAEWFVTDYFTADLEPSGSADVRTALPTGALLPPLPQDGTASLSYVEWARAFSVQRLADGVFLVGVAFRTLAAPPERGFRRMPVRAVDVRVAVSPAGGSTVVDLPAPRPFPAGPEPMAWSEVTDIAPQIVVDGAMRAAIGWGSDHRLVGASLVPRGWRVVLTAADEVGNRWPVALLVDDAGLPMAG